jgi:hypothetical protein
MALILAKQVLSSHCGQGNLWGSKLPVATDVLGEARIFA